MLIKTASQVLTELESLIIKIFGLTKDNSKMAQQMNPLLILVQDSFSILQKVMLIILKLAFPQL
jgi:hypothetical protein